MSKRREQPAQISDHIFRTVRMSHPESPRFSEEKYTKYIKHVTHLGSNGVVDHWLSARGVSQLCRPGLPRCRPR